MTPAVGMPLSDLANLLLAVVVGVVAFFAMVGVGLVGGYLGKRANRARLKATLERYKGLPNAGRPNSHRKKTSVITNLRRLLRLTKKTRHDEGTEDNHDSD